MNTEKFDRDWWIENICMFTYSCSCDACPYVVYDQYGRRKCEPEMMRRCVEEEETEETEETEEMKD